MGVRVVGISGPDVGKSIGQWVKRLTIKTAREELREEVNKGFDNRPVVITDGVPRRSPEEVRPFGKIIFVARPNMANVVLWALDQLRKHSPVLTGRYVQSHVVMINGQEIAGGNVALALREVKDTDHVQIVNPLPYARKIEGATARKGRKKGSPAMRAGRAKRAGSSAQAKNGVYRVVLRELVSRFNRSMFFDYKLVKLNTGLKVWGKQGGGPGAKRVLRDQVYPALQFFIKPTGNPT